jgi:hypothetical protein
MRSSGLAALVVVNPDAGCVAVADWDSCDD